MNLAHLIDEHDPARVALVSRGHGTTYGTLRDDVARCRGGLAAHGIGDGDRVVLLCGNSPFFVVTYLATIGLGAIAVPLNPASPAHEVERQIATVGAAAVVVEASAAAAWRAVERSAVATVRTVVSTEGHGIDDALTFDDLLTAEPEPIVELEPEHIAVLMFTSGTAGMPRAAMLTHGNLEAAIAQGRSVRRNLNPDDVVYGVLPLFHIYGLNVMLGLSLSVGCTIVLVQRFDPSTALDTIRDRNVTVVLGAPPMWVAFSHFDDAPADAFAQVRMAFTGAAKMPQEAMRRMSDRFGVQILEGYGLTEASPGVTSSAGLEPRMGSVGRLLDGVEVRLVDDDGADALAGDAGEIWVRGPNVFVGYWDDPVATARVLTPDRWLRTGDIGVTDDDGYLYLVDRAKDLIIVSGFNVYPAEVENVLASHPGVKECGVIGVPHPHTGEAVKAYVVLEEGARLDEDTLIAWCMNELARYKCPSKVLITDELPRNVSGKLLRRELV